MNSQLRVFDSTTVMRLALQNNVLRKLRHLGCKVKAATLDAALTISVEPSDHFRRRPQAGGLLKQRGADGCLVSIDVDGCRVIWLEANT